MIVCTLYFRQVDTPLIKDPFSYFLVFQLYLFLSSLSVLVVQRIAFLLF